MLGLVDYVRHAVGFYRLGARIKGRGRTWARGYKRYLAGRQPEPPFPKVVQIIPTERCNLRCNMCNQWGDNGYFLTGKRPVSSMPIAELIGFLERYRDIECDFTLSVHGGEPFMYRNMPELLDYVADRRVDTFFSTNGTLLAPVAPMLARINRHAIYLLSIDGGEDTNDLIRGKGVTRKIVESIRALREQSLKIGNGLPKLVVNYCVNEHNPDDIDRIDSIAREVGAMVVNYNLRWYLPEENGHAYNRILENEFGVRPTNAWTGWVTANSFDRIYGAIDRIYDKTRRQYFRPRIPFLTTIPVGLSRAQAKSFYQNYNDVFGITSCIMPSAWLRVHSRGELIYCPGHPDLSPGNVFSGDIREIYLNEISRKLRKRVEKELLPICNRCCGLYMTHNATKHLGSGFVPERRRE